MGRLRPTKRAINLPLPLSPAGEEFDPPAGRQQFGKGSLTLYLPTELNEGHHSVHKRAIVTLTIQLWLATAGTAVATAAMAGTAVAAGAATAFKAETAFAATGLGHAALRVASGAASMAAVFGSEALDRKAKIEAISRTNRPEPMPITRNLDGTRVK